MSTSAVTHTQSTLSRCRGNPLQPPSYRHVTVLMTSRASQISRTTESFEKFCLPTINEIFATFLVFQQKCHRQSKSEPWVLGFLPGLFFEKQITITQSILHGQVSPCLRKTRPKAFNPFVKGAFHELAD